LHQKFDVIVVGAGTGGCTVAKGLASAGLRTCLVDYKTSETIGKKVCGDAIGKHHFDDLGLTYPRGSELERYILGITVYSPDRETAFQIVGEGLHGFMVNRYMFGQRLLKEAVDSGVTLMDSTKVLGPIVHHGVVEGVVAKDINSNRTLRLRSDTVVDASGVSAAVRSKLPVEMGVERDVNKDDLIIAYREIRVLKEELPEPELCRIYLNLDVAPGGYYWIFPEGGTKVNVGLGVAASSKINPKEALYKYVLSGFHRDLFDGSSILHAGGGIVPTRRPLNSFVSNGFVAIGDAACHVNPLHGGGIGPSMIGGTIAAEVISKAHENGDLGIQGLWPINVRYMRHYGVKQAGLDVFRFFLQHLSNDLLNYGMKYRLIKEEDVLKVSLGEDIHLNITDITRRIFTGLGRLSFLSKLRRMAQLVKEAKALYRTYPESPDKLGAWIDGVNRLFIRVREVLK